MTTNATAELGYANYCGWSDVEPFEVVRVVSEKCREVRAMKCEQGEWEMKSVPGGFSRVVTNQMSQEWIITPDESAEVFRIRLRKDGRWYDAHGGLYNLSDAPRKFYDFNF